MFSLFGYFKTITVYKFKVKFNGVNLYKNLSFYFIATRYKNVWIYHSMNLIMLFSNGNVDSCNFLPRIPKTNNNWYLQIC